MGFTLAPAERDELIAADGSNAERIFPYLGGEEVNTSPTQNFHRYVIGFGQMRLEEAERWADLLEIVREKVKPERNRNNRANYREKWWQFGEARPGLYEALAGLERCLVTARVTKHLCFSFQPTDRIFAETTYALPLPAFTSFAVLQSRIHEFWARLLSSSLEDRLRYAASDCFETFPFPQPDPRAEIPALEDIGQRLYDARAKYMIDTDQGLTKTYNALKDPEHDDPRIDELRALHVEMDHAVLAAYGPDWAKVEVPPFTTPATPAEKRALEAFEDEVVDRLFVLNAERAEEERIKGLTKNGKKRAGKGGRRKSSARRSATPKLL